MIPLSFREPKQHNIFDRLPSCGVFPISERAMLPNQCMSDGWAQRWSCSVCACEPCQFYYPSPRMYFAGNTGNAQEAQYIQILVDFVFSAKSKNSEHMLSKRIFQKKKIPYIFILINKTKCEMVS